MTSAPDHGSRGAPREVLLLPDAGQATGLAPDGTLFLVPEGGELRCLDDTGRELWTAPAPPGGGRRPPAAAWSPDGSELLVLSDGAVRAYDGDTGEPRPLPAEFTAAPDARALAVSPDGLRVVCPRDRGGVLVHHRGTMTVHSLPTVDRAVGFVWDPQGRQLCVATASALQLWNVSRVRMDFSPCGGRQAITAVAWSPDREYLAFCDAEGAHLVHRSTGRITASAPAGGPALGLAFSRTGQFLAVATAWQVTVHDRSLDVVTRIPAALEDPAHFSASASGRLLLRAADGTGLWELPDSQAQATRRPTSTNLRRWTAAMCRSVGRDVPSYAGGAPRLGAFSLLHTAGAGALAPGFAWTGGPGGHVHEMAPGVLAARTVGTPGVLWTAAADTGPGGALDIEAAPDAPRVAVATRGGGRPVRVLDSRDGRLLATLPGGQGPAWDPTGTMLAVPEPGPDPTHLYVHTPGAPQRPPLSRLAADGLGRPAWSPDGTLLAAGTRGAVLLWRMPEFSRTEPRLSRSSGAFLTRVAWSPDGGRLAATPAAGGGPLVVWSTDTWQVFREFGTPGGRGWAPALAWSPDGSLLAAPAAGENTPVAEVWDVNRGTVVMTLDPAGAVRGHLWTVRWSPGGDRLVTTYGDGRTLLWQVISGRGQDTAGPVLRLPPAELAELGAASAGAGGGVPLSALADIVDLLRPAPTGSLRLLYGSRSARALRALGWPAAARPALTAVVAAGLRPDPRYLPPPGIRAAELRDALESGLGGADTRPEPHGVRPADVAHALERLRHEVLPLLALLGPDAVRQDPGLVKRLVTEPAAAGAPVVRRRPRFGGRAPVPAGDLVAGPAAAGAPASLARHGPPDRVLPSQLAMPDAVLDFLWAQDALLYRTRRGDPPRVHRDAVLVLDTGAAAHGQVGSALRLSAFLLAEALIGAGRALDLVPLSGRGEPVRLARTADLRCLWETVPPAPPRPERAAELAARSAQRLADPVSGTPRAVLFTHAHQPRLPLRDALTVRVHYPGHPVPVPDPNSWMLPPDPPREALYAVLGALLGEL